MIDVSNASLVPSVRPRACPPVAIRSSTLGWATFRTAIRYHFPPDVAPPGAGREPAPHARLTPERPGLGDSPSKLLRFPMAVSCCGVAEGASPRLDEPGTIAK